MRRGTLAVLAVAVLVSVIVVERHTLAESLHVLAHLNWAWFVLALASEAVSLSSFGLSRTLLMRVNGRPTSFSSVMVITYAANALSISVPFAGAELAVVFSYRQFRRHGVDAATTGRFRVTGQRGGLPRRFRVHRPGRRGAARAAFRERPQALAPGHRLAGRPVPERPGGARPRCRRLG